MSEYSWPDDGIEVDARTQVAWQATYKALPTGTRVTGEVIGRQPFGVFLRIDGVKDAIGLAEITARPHDAELLQIGTHVSGEVLGYVEHNHQVKTAVVILVYRPPCSSEMTSMEAGSFSSRQ
ncbi:hypothetical protein [Streptomyces prasinus]|uniref:hypothetical protein n=1 Tax=Streptomyces prasinus TaxID=67345 RepID=UPI0007C7CB3E|nr:hypothetical protein [Streptomyces prasinus]